MNKDVTTEKIGTLLDGTESRDAIHIAVAPVIANRTLFPSQRIGFVKDKFNHVEESDSPIGIVDPFLRHPVSKGQMFFMFLFPQTITNMRHEWQHPAFPDTTKAITPAGDSAKMNAQEWMDRFASQHYEPYKGDRQCTGHQLVEAGREYLHDGTRMVQQGAESLRDDMTGEELHEFWKNFEIITGIKVDDKSASPFCCTC